MTMRKRVVIARPRRPTNEKLVDRAFDGDPHALAWIRGREVVSLLRSIDARLYRIECGESELAVGGYVRVGGHVTAEPG